MENKSIKKYINDILNIEWQLFNKKSIENIKIDIVNEKNNSIFLLYLIRIKFLYFLYMEDYENYKNLKIRLLSHNKTTEKEKKVINKLYEYCNYEKNIVSDKKLDIEIYKITMETDPFECLLYGLVNKKINQKKLDEYLELYENYSETFIIRKILLKKGIIKINQKG